MGEYAEALYLKNPHLREVDPGDVSKEIEVRRKHIHVHRKTKRCRLSVSHSVRVRYS